MVPKIGMINNQNFLSKTDTSDDPLKKIIDKYKNHPSITCINKHVPTTELILNFNF